MADAIVSAVAEQLVSIIKAQIQNEIHLVRGVDEELLDLSDKLKKIRNVLDDADKQQFKKKTVKDWLWRLERTSHEMEDVLDEWNYAILQHKIQSQSQSAASSNRKGLSSFGSLTKPAMKRKHNERGFPRIPGDPLVVSDRSHLTWLETVRDLLGQVNLELVRSSCFKHVIRLAPLEFHAAVYQELLRCLDKRSLATNTLRFLINGEAVVFGPTEFALMTGLNFNGCSHPPTSSLFHDSVFGGKKKVSVLQLHDRFRDECSGTTGSSHVCLQLGLLYILFSTLLFPGRVTDPIDMNYLHLLDDLDKLNAFPWGVIAYNFLIKHTHDARDSLESISRESNQKVGNQLELPAPGFTVALLFWAYEVMPALADICARRLGSEEERIPRMLWWYTNTYVDRSRIKQLFFLRNSIAKVPLDVSSAEAKILSLNGPFSSGQLPSTPIPSLAPTTNQTRSPYSPNVDVGLQNLRIRMLLSDLDRPAPQKCSTSGIGRGKRTTRKYNTKTKGAGVLHNATVAASVKQHMMQSGISATLRTCSPLTQKHNAAQLAAPAPRSCAPSDRVIDYGPHIPESANILSVVEVGRKLGELQQLYHSLTGCSFPPTIQHPITPAPLSGHINYPSVATTGVPYTPLVPLLASVYNPSPSSRDSQQPPWSLSLSTQMPFPPLSLGSNPPAPLSSSPHYPFPAISQNVLPVAPVSQNTHYYFPPISQGTLPPAPTTSSADYTFPPQILNPSPNAPLSLSPEYAGVLSAAERRSVPCRQLTYDDRAGHQSVAAYSSERSGLYSSRLDLLSAVTLDDDANFSEFNKWYKLADPVNKTQNTVPIPTHMDVGVMREWFDTLWNPDGLLLCQHIDALLAYFLRNARADPDNNYKDSWSVMDTTCWGALSSNDWSLVEQLVFPYAQGAYVEDWGVSWAESRRIIGVAHMKTEHWVSYTISIDDQSIIVYDSLHKQNQWSFVKEEFESMAAIVPKICRQCDICPIKNGVPQVLKQKFDVWPEEDVPQQVNGTDCGIMALQYVDCLMRNCPLTSIIPSLCAYRRKTFCWMLYEFGLQVIHSRAESRLPKK